MDLAFSEGNRHKKVKRDFTAIAVVAWDADGYLYVLDLVRFQTDRAEIYYQKAIELHQYWNFREVTVETNAGGNVIANFVQDEVRRAGETLVVKHQTKNQREGTKEERNAQTKAWRDNMKTMGYTSRTLPAALESAGAVGIVASYWSKGFGVNKIFSARTKTIPTVDLELEDYDRVE